jgi:hypothetical protein
MYLVLDCRQWPLPLPFNFFNEEEVSSRHQVEKMRPISVLHDIVTGLYRVADGCAGQIAPHAGMIQLERKEPTYICALGRANFVPLIGQAKLDRTLMHQVSTHYILT